MEENFKKVIEDIKEATIDPEETKKYILAIKRVVREIYDACKDEQEGSEIVKEYLEDYEKSLEFRGNVKPMFNKMLTYNTYKSLLTAYRGNKNNFYSVIREAKKREATNNKSTLAINVDLNESMITVIRYLIRKENITSEKGILEYIQKEKSEVAKKLKNEMIKIIHSSVGTLEEYGFIDEYIEASNSELEQLGLEQLKLSKRNPIADEQYDSDGQLVEDVEDIGVIDTFSKENLEKMSVEDLEVMATFWESKYFQERLGLAKAISTIKTLNLWDAILYEDDEKIENLDNDKIGGALKKDLALTYLCKNESKITNKMKKQYRKFLDGEKMPSDIEIDDEIRSLVPEVANLEEASKDIAILECSILYQLKNGVMKIKKWGVIQEDKTEQVDYEKDEKDGVVMGIENKNFRGPLIMEVPESVLRTFFSGEESKFPKYERKFDETYCDIMSKLYLPTNNFFTKMVKKAYKENPQSQLLADLAGKKVKSGEER